MMFLRRINWDLVEQRVAMALVVALMAILAADSFRAAVFWTVDDPRRSGAVFLQGIE